ncbi:MAG: tetratricopeptide repeat protein [Planctomycetes bacterium]|nr:tetratricopeptide repeat protein [Planctomycetota bacterium]
MRKAWLKTFAASLAAVAMAGSSVLANPALMVARRPVATTTSDDTSAVAQAVAPVETDATWPSAKIWPMRNPFKYLTASISEMPIPLYGKRKASTNPVMPAATEHGDSIVPSAPTAVPTPQSFISTAQMCESRGDVAQARANYQQALNSWPGQVDVLRAAARMEDRLGQLPVAECLYRQAVTSNPQHAGALNDLGLCLARQGKLDASVQFIEQAIQLQPAKPLYRNNAATVLVEMRQDQRALAHLAAVHNAADANYNFGQLLVQRGRPVDATPYFQAAVEQNPQMQHAHVALAKLRGEQVPAAATYTPTTTPQPQTPAVQQQSPPTDAPPYDPQLTFPATAARAPGVYPQTGMPTRYLPPVAARPSPRPSPMQR